MEVQIITIPRTNRPCAQDAQGLRRGLGHNGADGSSVPTTLGVGFWVGNLGCGFGVWVGGWFGKADTGGLGRCPDSETQLT